MNTVTRLARPLILAVLFLAAITFLSVACGGGSNPSTGGTTGSGGGGVQAQLRHILHSAPVNLFFDGRRSFKTTATNWSPIPVANAQTASPTIGRGNFAGACGTLPNPTISVAATVLNNLGRLTDGRCGDRSTPDSPSGNVVREDGTCGNIEFDVYGTRTNAQSGRLEVYLDNAIVKTYIMGVTAVPAGTPAHFEDLTPNAQFTCHKGQRIKTRYWQQAGDVESDLQASIGWGPTS